MAYQALASNEITSGAPLDAALLSKIKNNFEAQQDQFIAKQDIINRTVPIGTYVQSDLTPTQFASVTIGTWFLADGRTATGTAYATLTGKTNVPDARGVYLRSKDNGVGRDSSGDLATGTFEADSTKRPNSGFTGSTNNGGAHAHTYWRGGLVAGSGYPSGTANGAGAQATSSDPGHAHSVSIDAGGDAETRPKSIIVNTYIKVGY